MATVNFCERVGCEAMGKSHVMGEMRLVTAEDREQQTLELCPGCVAEVVEWLGNPPTGDRPKAYTEAWKPTEDKSPEEMSVEEIFALGIKKMNEDAQKIERKSLGSGT